MLLGIPKDEVEECSTHPIDDITPFLLLGFLTQTYILSLL
jgi:hypothetical protein